MRIEEFLHVPALGIIQRQSLDLIPIGGGEKRPKAIVVAVRDEVAVVKQTG